jgi:phage/plasmid-like protein (TIGR03299 family)
MTSTYNTPWSEIGVDISSHTHIAKAFEDAGLNFAVECYPACYGTAHKRASGHYFIVRTDTETVLGHCKHRYKPVQNSEMLELIEELVKLKVGRLDTAGVMYNGERVWVLMKLDGHYVVDSCLHETIDKYLLIINGHDGETSLSLGIIPIRPACTNMFPRLTGGFKKYKHTSGLNRDRLGVELASMLTGIHDYLEKLRTLAAIDIEISDHEKYVQKFIPKRHWKQVYLPLPRTWYDSFNNLTHYFNYLSGRRQESRLNSLWFGANSGKMSALLTYAVEKVLTHEGK